MPVPLHQVCPRCGSSMRRASGGVCARCLLETALSEPVPAFPEDPAEEVGAERECSLGRFGRYELLEQVAHGGMGIVYRARDLSLNRVVALKLMLAGQFASEREVKRFRAEAEAAARLDHPNIVPIYEVGEQDGRPFFSMKFMDGGTLTQRLASADSRLSARQAAVLLAKIARAVHHAHQRAVLHRDIKPGNILLDAQGEPQVSDFGLAKCLDNADSLTLSGAMLGSPNYMSPEQAAGHAERLTTAADVYSLGAVLYELLTGRPPFRANTPLETMRRVIDEPPVPPHLICDSADGDLETICLKCMEKEPARRYSSADALGEDLERWLKGEPIRARPITLFESMVKWVRRKPKVAALVMLLNLLFLVALGLGLRMNHHLAAAKNEAVQAKVSLAKELRDLQWQKVEELASAGKVSDALAYLSRFLRQDPRDHVAAARALSMLSLRNFVLPSAPPLKHDGPVNSAVFSADGELVATASNDGTAKLWDARNGQALARFTHSAPVRFAEFAGGTHRVLTVCDDGYARIWDDNDSPMLAMKVANSLPEAAKLSPDAKWFAAPIDASTIRLYDTASGQLCGSPIPLRDVRPRLQFSPDSRQLAVIARSGDAELWKVPSGAFSVGPIQSGGEISIMAFSPDSRWLFIGYVAGRSVVFDAQTGAIIKELPTHQNDVLTAEFSSDGQLLATIGWSQPVRIRNTRSWELVCTPFDAAIMRVGFRFAGDGKRIVTFFQHGGARLRDNFTGQPLAEHFEHDGPIVDARFSPDGGQLVSASQDGTARLWTTRMKQSGRFELQTGSYIWDAEPSPDGRFIVATRESAAQLFDMRTGQPVGQLMAHRAMVYGARFSPDGKRVATGSHDSTARVWSVPGGEPITPELIHQQRVMLVCFSPDSQSLMTASDDRTAKLWNAANGKPIFSLPHDSEVTDARFSEVGEKIVTATAQGTISIWSARTGQLIHGPLQHKGVVWTARLNRDGTRLLSASYDKSARIWDALTGQVLGSFQHPQGVLGAVFSPDEKSVLTCSLDGMVRIWDVASGAMSAQPMRHSAKVLWAFFSPDGLRVVTASEDHTSRLWDANTGYPVSEAIEHPGIVRRARFSPDGRQVFTAADVGIIKVWENPKPPPAAPAWFCDLLEALAGRVLNDRGDIELVPQERLASLRDKLSSRTEPDFYSRWARWFFVERSREPTPAFTP